MLGRRLGEAGRGSEKEAAAEVQAFQPQAFPRGCPTGPASPLLSALQDAVPAKASPAWPKLGSESESHSVKSDSLQTHCLSMGFFRQEYWNGLPFPSPGNLSHPGAESGSPALQADSLLSKLQGKPA